MEFAAAAKFEVGSNGKAKFEKSVPGIAATTCPPVVVLRSEPLAMPEIQRLVVEALPETESVVVVAFEVVALRAVKF